MKQRDIFNILFIIVITMVAFSCSSCDEKEIDIPKEEAVNHRTVLVYMAAENSLSKFVKGTKGDVTEMLAGCKYIPDSCELVVYVDDTSNPRLYTITNKTTAASIDDITPELSYDDDSNAASPEVLANILNYVSTKHKARSYGLVLWSHGSGWVESENLEEVRSRSGRKTSFGVDNLKNTYSDTGLEMEITDLASVLEKQENLDFVLFDACFMQSIETLYTLRNSADYIIGSPAEIPGLGAPYNKIMSAMFAEPLVPSDIAKKYYEYYLNEDTYYEGALLSVVCTKNLEDFAAQTRVALSGTDLKKGTFVGVMDYFYYDTWRLRSLNSMPDFYDMKGLLKYNLTEEKYNKWLKALDMITTAKYATSTWYTGYYGLDIPVDSTQFSGISMYVPLQKYIDHQEPFTSGYYKTDWYKAVFQ